MTSSLWPDSSDDGPVTVYLENGNKVEYDRIRFNGAGAVTLYDVVRSGNRIRKGNRATVIPMHRIVEIEYEDYGP